MVRGHTTSAQFNDQAIDGEEEGREIADPQVEQGSTNGIGKPNAQGAEQHGGKSQRDLIHAEQPYAEGHRPKREGLLVQPNMVGRPVLGVVR